MTKGAPRVSATLSKKVVKTNQNARLTVRVTGLPTVPKGTKVLVFDGSKVVRTVTVPASGRVRVTLPKLSRGKHRLRAYVVAGRGVPGRLQLASDAEGQEEVAARKCGAAGPVRICGAARLYLTFLVARDVFATLA
ncbi:hypothetical protein [Aeromicrobium sp. UC242_57]|uniref:hypothetical protein n=1 Tax=Aeromicrobium sp. UC242_57 TaxID=3374624 RepID=UPI0037B469F2